MLRALALALDDDGVFATFHDRDLGSSAGRQLAIGVDVGHDALRGGLVDAGGGPRADFVDRFGGQAGIRAVGLQCAEGTSVFGQRAASHQGCERDRHQFHLHLHYSRMLRNSIYTIDPTTLLSISFFSHIDTVD